MSGLKRLLVAVSVAAWIGISGYGVHYHVPSALAAGVHQVHVLKCKKPCIFRISGSGNLLTDRKDGNDFTSVPDGQTFLAPAHFKVKFAYNCAGTNFVLFADGYDGTMTESFVGSKDNAHKGQGSKYVDTPHSLRTTFTVLGAGCAWDISALRLS